MQGVLDAADKDAILRCVKLRVRHVLCLLLLVFCFLVMIGLRSICACFAGREATFERAFAVCKG